MEFCKPKWPTLYVGHFGLLFPGKKSEVFNGNRYFRKMISFSNRNLQAKARLSYEPDDVDVRLQHFRVYEIIELVSGGALDILEEVYEFMSDQGEETGKRELPQLSLFTDEELDIESEDDLQRKSGLWNLVQMSQFIESLMIKLPIPMFYFDGSEKPWRVIDGLQRLHTISRFLAGKFKLCGLEFLANECDGLDWQKIPGFLKARILDAEIVAYVINPGTPADVKYNIFKRINTGGLKLNGQEIRNAFFRGKPIDFLKKLAAKKVFLAATNGKVPARRMVDREYANRFLAFQLFSFTEYNGKMDFFLTEALRSVRELSPSELDEIENSFETAMTRSLEVFGAMAFYRPRNDDEWGRQPNKALFDTLSWNLSAIGPDCFANILKRKDEFLIAYRKFMNEDSAMFKAINDTTGSKGAVTNRFRLVEEFMEDYQK